MRGYRGASGHPNACCCDSSKCEEIGYSHEGMMRVPQDETKCDATIRLLGIQCSDLRKKIRDNPKAYYVGPWHYHKEHRMRGENGNWMIRPLPTYKDKENVVYPFAPPNASVEAFINEEIPSYGFCRGGYEIRRLVARVGGGGTAIPRGEGRGRLCPNPDRPASLGAGKRDHSLNVNVSVGLVVGW